MPAYNPGPPAPPPITEEAIVNRDEPPISVEDDYSDEIPF
jgi:hypothetical protein